MFGLLLGLALLKFGNPVIMEKYVTWPTNLYEWLLTPWPVVIGYWLLAAVATLGLVVTRRRRGLPLVLAALPLVWWIWEVEAAAQSEVARISWPVVVHFGTCVVCFYLGLFSLSGVRRLGFFWMGLLAGFIIVLGSGLSQHFGGLEETRRYWFMYVYPTIKEIPPGLYKKMESNRIFATLFYPNTLAGVILLLLPVTMAVFWTMQQEFTVGARWLLMGLAAAAALGCLYWSGSKGGWLLMLIIVVVGAMYLPIKLQTKLALGALLLMLGLAGFMAKNLGYFKKGATSVNARFDYWSAAIKVVNQKPLFGNGPGTFGKAYQRLKRPESEMAQMAHNDYLEQASDSGLIGFLAFSAFVFGTLVYAWRNGQLRGDWVRLAVWLGLLGWALQSFVEFGLFIPAISWLAFAWMGWLLGQCRNQFDSGKPAS